MAPDESDPPRKFYGLKAREFDAVNARSDDQPAIDVRDHFRQPPAPGANPVRPPGPVDTDVHAILRENVARANEAGLNDLAEKPRRRSLRKRDYWLLMGAGNGFFLLGGVMQGGIAMIYGGAGIILFTVGVTWVMWFVMDDY